MSRCHPRTSLGGSQLTRRAPSPIRVTDVVLAVVAAAVVDDCDCDSMVHTRVVQKGAKMIWQMVVKIPGSQVKVGAAVWLVVAGVDVIWVTAPVAGVEGVATV